MAEPASAETLTGLDRSVVEPFLVGILSHLYGGVFTIDKNKRITLFSKSAMWLTGFGLDDVIGKECGSIFRANMCRNSCPFDNAIKKGSSTNRRYVEIYGKDGKPIPCNITAFPLRNTEGEIVGMAEIFRDARELKALTSQLLQSDRLAILGQVSAGVAHEINNPLNGILTYIKLMNRKLRSNPAAAESLGKYLDTMERETRNMARIVRNLLDFSRRKDPEIVPLQLGEVMEQSLLLLGDQLKVHNIEVVREDEPGVPDVTGDFGQLQQVFVNIVLNSIQAMPDGGRLLIRITAEGKRKSFVSVNISDTGCGISEENVAKIFEPLFTTKGGKDSVGLGLGLAIVQRIVEEHHGSIDVTSKVSKGTTFNIRFPAR
ncbi:MAG: PAS domain-containing protein [candidate division WOR-3 bacterium]|nr:MAG: PAS domain-containing protein [candidate division WOR-3 bacterium]